MPAPQAVSDLYAAQQRRILAATVSARAEWAKISKPDQFGRIATRLQALIAAAQLGAVRDGAAMVPAALQQSGFPENPLGTVNPAGFVNIASDGRALDSLLWLTPAMAEQAGGPIVQQMAAGQNFLDLLVQRQVADAGRGASGVAITATANCGWVRYVNPPCCQRCGILAGRIYRHSHGFQRHHRCFPAGVVVSGPRVEASTRRWYEGELVVLSTASGKDLSLTGNHPVLTGRGWIPAHLLNEGDRVFRSTRPEGAGALVVPDHEQVPTLIEDVWGALGVGGLDRVPSTAEDFHGDGRDGEIDIVWADGSLRDWLVAGLDECGSEGALALAWPMPTAPCLQGQRGASRLDTWPAPCAGGTVGCRGLGSALIDAHLGGAYDPRLAHAAPLDAGTFENACDWAARDAVLAAESVLTGTSLVLPHDLLYGQRSASPRWDAPGAPFTSDTRAGYARQGLDLLEALTGQIEGDRLVEVRRVEFRGHVYSLTSSEGWHTANNLIVSNCDCQMRPVSDREPPAGYTDTVTPDQIHDLTEAQRQALAEGADLNRTVNAYRSRLSGRDKMTTTAELSAKGQRRLTPDGIYRLAGDNRQKAIEMLRSYGYLL